jgi:hypothetical protein
MTPLASWLTGVLKPGPSALTALSTVLLLAGATGASAQQVVPVHQEPRHRLVLERPLFRILDVRLPADDTTLFHIHDAPIHYVLINRSPIHAQALGQPWPPLDPASDSLPPVGNGWWTLEYAREPLTHRVANIGSELFRLIAVINRGPGRPNPSVDAASSRMPGSFEAESEWFIRSRLSLQPGEESRAETLVSPIVVVQVSPGEAELWTRDDLAGSTRAAGDWLVLDRGSTYRLRNPGHGVATLILVEVLTPPD